MNGYGAIEKMSLWADMIHIVAAKHSELQHHLLGDLLVLDYLNHGVGIATARAGNVVGGGDWSKDRLLPDIISAYENSQKLIIRNPESTRPWQHVLEPLYGYIMLAEKLYFEVINTRSMEFGPESTHAISVLNLIERLNKILPNS